MSRARIAPCASLLRSASDAIGANAIILAVSVELEPRVTALEALMADVLRAVHATSLSVERLSRDMREFKEEMRAFKGEHLAFK